MVAVHAHAGHVRARVQLNLPKTSGLPGRGLDERLAGEFAAAAYTDHTFLQQICATFAKSGRRIYVQAVICRQVALLPHRHVLTTFGCHLSNIRCFAVIDSGCDAVLRTKLLWRKPIIHCRRLPSHHWSATSFSWLLHTVKLTVGHSLYKTRCKPLAVDWCLFNPLDNSVNAAWKQGDLTVVTWTITLLMCCRQSSAEAVVSVEAT